jgi:hypothetical protein
VAAATPALLVTLWSTRAEAYRPFDGTDADVAEWKTFELELGPVHYYRELRRNSLIAPALVLNFGIFERTELVIDANQFLGIDPPQAGSARVRLLGDDVMLKHVFLEGTMQDKPGPSLAAEGGVLTPEVNGESGLGASLDIITSYRWSWGTIHQNEWFEITRAHHADLFTGVILEGPHDWAIRPVAEGFYDKDFAGGQVASLLVGAIWDAREALAFDVGLRGARMSGGYAEEIRLGLTWSLPLTGSTTEESAARRNHRSLSRR